MTGIGSYEQHVFITPSVYIYLAKLYHWISVSHEKKIKILYYFYMYRVHTYFVLSTKLCSYILIVLKVH